MKSGQDTYLKRGSTAYLTVSTGVRRVEILSCAGGLYTVRFAEGGGTRVGKHRLFQTAEEAGAKPETGEEEPKRIHSPHLMGALLNDR